ncbi:hypothetical protein BLS_010101 [Venturia inaequalis]|uniref:DNA polymerase n=1 Tax=Venturia inaequalis TaxID=5025 RepID=A0A8H3UYP3_VENIN|nr:hypothetical protein BLS_010101 [Venturia inaequalis]KAE9984521.1 hypothetical protein EG328_008549 [Venturia inaequalis]KAE9988120.1 hypothetical protein EG327_003479 [Venturia inaequalis]RDI88983.1 hypothetical protein Vi05172_g1276 [Venturia inaequalis]
MSSKRAARLAQLEKLKKARSGKRDNEYEVEEEANIYDEVDEEGYKKVVRGRLDQDDFVVDDNGEGYADDGREEDWEDGHRAGYSSEEDNAPRGKAAKRKREEDDEKKKKIKNGISNYFTAKATTTAPKPKPVKTADDDAFMADLLGEVDVNVPSRPAIRMKPVKDEHRRKTRVLSPPIMKRQPKSSSRIDSSQTAEITIPAEANDDDGYTPMDDDVLMSDPLPSSPVMKAVERRSQPAVKVEEEEEDDDLDVAQPIGQSKSAGASINMSGKRPAPKFKATPPTAIPSSPAGPAVDASAWNRLNESLNVMSSPVGPQVASNVGKLNPQHAVEEDGSLNFFWTDYTEILGSLCLFGKVKDKSTGNFVSCFVKIDNILRKLFFLPREFRQKHGRPTDEEIGMSDVYNEVDGIMSKLRVGQFKIKPCERKYAFEIPGIPKKADYLKLLYPYDKQGLSNDLTGETFSHVFGTNTALFEQFVLWKNIMGPCWLNIQGANFQALHNASWCKLELVVDQPQKISTLGESDNLDVPPLTLMSIALRTTFSSENNKQEILMISARIYENVVLGDTTPPEKMPCKSFTIMRPIADSYPTGFEKLELPKHKGTIMLERNERDLLSKFMAILGKMDPDVLMGHKLDDVDFGILLSRMKERNTPGWHRIGRLRRNDWPKNFGRGGGSFFAERQLASGRLLVDLANDMGKSLMMKCQSWSLNEMCELVLGKNHVRLELDNEAVLKTWALEREGLMNYVQHCEADTFFIAAIAIKTQMLPLTKVLTNLAGNSWARTLSGTRAERNEYILLHEFHRNKFICPDKIWGKGKQKIEEEPAEGEEGVDAKKKDKFKGGLVFEPEKGLYDKFILVMDFNSLYPSIIQEYNICFTTVERANLKEDDEQVPDVPGDQALGILPKLIATLVNRRREVKKLMKDKTATPDQLATYDIKQLALKLTANSMYGCLGYTKSRFYARPLAMLTTYKGREILQSTKELAEQDSLRVIYGDTDSVMINTNKDNIQEALAIGRGFKKAVNERYRLLEIDIDNVFRRILLHAKKKYAAINMVEIDGKFVEKLEVKGLDMRRREYCALSKETSSKLLGFLLSGDEPDTVVENIHEYLRALATRMRDYQVPVQAYTIFTQLGKAPKEYPNGGSMPSVQVALRQMAKGKNIKAKDVMSFIITGQSNGSAETAAKNAYPLEDILKADSGLKPDIDYYLHKQILPPVERLCAPISGTNITQLADCLGLDTSKYRVSTVSQTSSSRADDLQPLESQIPDSVRFKEALPLQLRCVACKSSFDFRGIVPPTTRTEDERLEAAVTNDGLQCPNAACQRLLPTITIVAQLEAQIRQHISRYYANWLVCDEPQCGNRTRQICVYGHRCLGPKGLGMGCLGRMHQEYTEKALYNQLLFLGSMFDVERAREKVETMAREGVLKGDRKDELRLLAEYNRLRFGTVRKVVKEFLARNGRQWVSMGNLFRFAM